MQMKKFDNSFLTDKIRYIAGTDEAGRGPLAGPVVAAAVIFDKDVWIKGVNDSKQLTEKEREDLLPPPGLTSCNDDLNRQIKNQT